MLDYRKYLVTLLITTAIFVTAIFTSNVLTQKKLEDVRAIEDRVALDILSSETQFALLGETSCREIGPGFLSKELGPLGQKLTHAENQSEFSASDIDSLKRSYFLLEIKDYLLMKRLTEKCGTAPTFILYFYSSSEPCKDCEKMGHVLTALREMYPEVRVYSFDYDFDLEAVRTLISIYKVEDNPPALIVNGEPHYGFYPIEDLEKNIPALAKLKKEKEAQEALMKATSSSTSSPAR